MPEPTTSQLSESDVEAIEALAGLKSLNYTDVDYVLERVPALVRDWRALTAENATLKNHWADTSEDLASALLKHEEQEQSNAALREQAAQLANFASHADECQWWGAIPRTTCSCGLADIVEKIK